MSGQRHAPTALPLGKSPGIHYRGGCVGPRLVWTDVNKTKSFALTWFRTLSHPALSDSLCRLRCYGSLLYRLCRYECVELRTNQKYHR